MSDNKIKVTFSNRVKHQPVLQKKDCGCNKTIEVIREMIQKVKEKKRFL